jgi:hypothetical protein
VLDWRVFSLISDLPSAFSADVLPSLFEWFIGTMPLSDSSQACIRAVRSQPSPVGPNSSGRLGGLPLLVQEVSRRVWGLRLRRTGHGLALSPKVMLPSAGLRASASRLDIFGAQYPAHLFPCLRFTAHLAAHSAKLGAEVVRFSFFVRISHPLLPAGCRVRQWRGPGFE